MTILEHFKRLMRWLGLNWFDYMPTPFDDVAHAGEYQGKLLTPAQMISLQLIGLIASAVDCILSDTSRWQLEIDYVKMVAYGIKGTILKAGQAAYVDPYFKQNYAKAQAAGLKRGTYWYYDSRVHPKLQAETWANLLKECGYGELPHFADYEENYEGSYAGIQWFALFLEEFQRLTRLPMDRLGIYTGYPYWTANGSTDPMFAGFWLWLAWYGPMANVIIPKPWTPERLWGWQYTSSGDGTAAGVSSKEIDLSYFVKGLAAYEQMYGDVAEIPPIGDPMEGLFEVWSDVYSMSLRSAPSINAAKVGTSIPRTTRMKSDQIVPPTSGGLAGDKWAHIIEVNGQVVDLWVAIIHNGVTYCNFKEVTPDPRPLPHMRVEFLDRDGKVWVLEGDMVERP